MGGKSAQLLRVGQVAWMWSAYDEEVCRRSGKGEPVGCLNKDMGSLPTFPAGDHADNGDICGKPELTASLGSIHGRIARKGDTGVADFGATGRFELILRFLASVGAAEDAGRGY